VPDEQRRAARALRERDEGGRALAHLRDAPRTRLDLAERHRLNGIDHEQPGPQRLDAVEDRREVGLGEEQQLVARAEPRGAQLRLRCRFFTADVHDRRPGRSGKPGRELQQERRLPRAGRPTEQHDAPGHDAAAEQRVELRTPRRQPRNRPERHVRESHRRRDGACRAALAVRSPGRGHCGRGFGERVPRLARRATAEPAHRLMATGRTEKDRARLGHVPLCFGRPHVGSHDVTVLSQRLPVTNR